MMPLEIPDTTKDQQIDLLDRQEFVDQIHNIALTLARNKKSKCYAINGGWGVGKSFVLDMFEEQAQKYGQEGTVLDQYVIFRYNCWEYDYYEEPLIAIVASILEQYEKKILFLQEEEKALLKETLIYIGKELLSIIRTGIKVATGVDIKPAISGAAEIKEAAQARVEENHSYDSLFAFKSVLRKLQDAFTSLSDHQAILIIVDELDRCLPVYTIKVLERLHHLFEGIPNIQVILSIDRSQLEHVVKQIYGQNTNSRKYLDKFIDFELKLPIGSLNDSIDSRFKEYFSCFACIRSDTHPSDVTEFQRIITESIDMRTRIAIIEKCHMIHDILATDTEVMDEEGSVALETMLRGICNKRNFMDLFENFILYDHSGGRTAKILARNHQYLGVNEAVEVYKQRKLRNGRLGVFWHTQGSGKSYSMLFLSQKIRRKFEGSPTFVVLTDRDELNKQISDTFENCGLLGGVKASKYIAQSGDDLIGKLKSNPTEKCGVMNLDWFVLPKCIEGAISIKMEYCTIR